MADPIEVTCPVPGCDQVRVFRPGPDDDGLGRTAALRERLARQHPHPTSRPLAEAFAGGDVSRVIGFRVNPVLDIGRLYPQWHQTAAAIAAAVAPWTHDAWYAQLRDAATLPAWSVISAQIGARVQALLQPVIAHAIDTSWIRELIRRYQAGNWADLDPDEASDVATLAEIASQGIAVAWVPRAAVLRKLMAADAHERAALLLACESEILDDCATAVESLTGGYHPPAQALAANILDTVLRVAFPLGPWQATARSARRSPGCKAATPWGTCGAGWHWHPYCWPWRSSTGGSTRYRTTTTGTPRRTTSLTYSTPGRTRSWQSWPPPPYCVKATRDSPPTRQIHE
jgi:hypothetical protein